MPTNRSRLEALEGRKSDTEHVIFRWQSWDEEVALDAYGRDRIGPHDKLLWVVGNDKGMGPTPYPRGPYFDPQGKWAAALAARGVDVMNGRAA